MCPELRTCEAPRCSERAEVVTPEGVLCEDHAEQLALELRTERRAFR